MCDIKGEIAEKVWHVLIKWIQVFCHVHIFVFLRNLATFRFENELSLQVRIIIPFPESLLNLSREFLSHSRSLVPPPITEVEVSERLFIYIQQSPNELQVSEI
jgi:hypothetical protein